VSTTPKQFGIRLKKLRIAQGISQQALAKNARISREYVSKLEAGRYDPTIGVVQRLAKALKVTLAELVE
jgi:transcriptional regulator with XRE-family HTH domain